MKNNETDLLNERLIDVEHKRATDLMLLKAQFHLAYESVKPVNLVKNLFHNVTTSPDIKNNIIGTAIGLGTGFLSKRLLIGNSLQPFKRGLGTLIQFAVTNLVAKKAQHLQSIGKILLNVFSKSEKDRKDWKKYSHLGNNN
ncbi:hypothetical protein [Flavobacterium sp.]|uniref:hypothetical protein n=1 Tax=Flavobacterium sp. TaxID=239 RepID=UPI00286A0727|nr:hypothetical protein [Flavobacterium sp.]